MRSIFFNVYFWYVCKPKNMHFLQYTFTWLYQCKVFAILCIADMGNVCVCSSIICSSVEGSACLCRISRFDTSADKRSTRLAANREVGMQHKWEITEAENVMRIYSIRLIRCKFCIFIWIAHYRWEVGRPVMGWLWLHTACVVNWHLIGIGFVIKDTDDNGDWKWE